VNKEGPILIIEDDIDDQVLIQFIFKKLAYKNELVFLENGEVAIEYLNKMTTIPFIIISDLNMPKVNGIELRKRVAANERINIKCIPYIIFSTSASQQNVDNAFLMGIQGYFKKPSSLESLSEIFKSIVEYWKISYSPGVFLA